MRHLFVMDPLEKLDPVMDTSLRIAFALHQISHESYATTPWELSWQRGESCARAQCRKLEFKSDAGSAKARSDVEVFSLSDFSTIHMRKDPPFDMDYIATTWLLDTAHATSKVYNSPSGLRSINEKAIILRYPDAIAPALVSANPEQMLQFIKNECQGDAMLKPLNLYSGKGIHRLTLADSNEEGILALLHNQTKGVLQMLLQPFDPAIFDGEVRVFAIHGEPIAWCLKRPAPGSYMANSSFGSTRHAYVPTPGECDLIKHISRDLLKYGIEIVGYDLIGGKISEINVTSPRLLTAPEDKNDYFKTIAEWLASAS